MLSGILPAIHGRASTPACRFSTTVVYQHLSKTCFRIHTDTKAVGREPAFQTPVGRLDVSSVSVRNLPATNGPASEPYPARTFLQGYIQGHPHTDLHCIVGEVTASASGQPQPNMDCATSTTNMLKMAKCETLITQ
jgi:hypothetical protein